jgi:hypothetical protein
MTHQSLENRHRGNLARGFESHPRRYAGRPGQKVGVEIRAGHRPTFRGPAGRARWSLPPSPQTAASRSSGREAPIRAPPVPPEGRARAPRPGCARPAGSRAPAAPRHPAIPARARRSSRRAVEPCWPYATASSSLLPDGSVSMGPAGVSSAPAPAAAERPSTRSRSSTPGRTMVAWRSAASPSGGGAAP